ncbi:hypothetical protein [Kribbella shirazensis]|uniref:Transmembrane protein n=1 Tax=Kribbella shirazensis TaxID=1105143 RepID=A0A7X6A4B8_9ACTN|nr:hypothetical protein [Kribbella shirazensis]NIK61322.1 hypothetical protein [Kribbella shirazensis]
MSSSHQHHAELFVAMQLRLCALGQNPLRRGVDRVEAVLLMTFVLAALLLIPAALALGVVVHEHVERSAAEVRAHAVAVRAVALDDTPDPGLAVDGPSTATVRVRWVDDSGTPHDGTADVPAGTQAGTEVRLWRNGDGRLSESPPVAPNSTAAALAIGLSLPVFGWPALAFVYRLAVRPLDRYRAEAWGREWERVASRWPRPWR